VSVLLDVVAIIRGLSSQMLNIFISNTEYCCLVSSALGTSYFYSMVHPGMVQLGVVYQV